MGYDKRIGAQFLDAGIGYGGSCFPKDVKALAHMAAVARLPSAAVERGDGDQPRRAPAFVAKLRRRARRARGRAIAVLGPAFKPNTDDIREAPQIAVVQALVKLGAQVQAYDPVAMDNARRVLTGVDFCSNAYEAAAGRDAVLLLTEWNEFKQHRPGARAQRPAPPGADRWPQRVRARRDARPGLRVRVRGPALSAAELSPSSLAGEPPWLAALGLTLADAHDGLLQCGVDIIEIPRIAAAIERW